MSHNVPASFPSSTSPASRRGLGGVIVFATVACVVVGGLLAYQLATPKAVSANTESTSSVAVPASVESKAVRIATLLPFAADQLLQMGVRPVCIPGLRGRAPEAWEGIPTVQLDHSAGPNLEQLIAVDPDYIITGSVYAQFMPHIESVTGATVLLMDVDSIESVTEHIGTLGEISGRQAQSEAIVATLQQRLEAPLQASGGQQQVDVLAVFGTPHSFYAFLPDSYLGDLVRHAGGRMGPSGLTSHKIYRGLAPLSMETVLAFDPDLLLVLFHGPEESSRAMFEGDPLWASLSAVHEGRMHFLADDLYAMRPGSQLDLAMAQVRGFVQGASEPRE